MAPLIVIACAGVAAVAVQLWGQPETPPAASGRDSHQKRLVAAKRSYELLVEAPVAFGAATAGPEETYRWSRRWMEAEQATENGRTTAEAHLKRTQTLEERIKQKHRAGGAPLSDVTAAEFYRIRAEERP